MVGDVGAVLAVDALDEGLVVVAHLVCKDSFFLSYIIIFCKFFGIHIVFS